MGDKVVNMRCSSETKKLNYPFEDGAARKAITATSRNLQNLKLVFLLVPIVYAYGRFSKKRTGLGPPPSGALNPKNPEIVRN